MPFDPGGTIRNTPVVHICLNHSVYILNQQELIELQSNKKEMTLKEFPLVV